MRGFEESKKRPGTGRAVFQETVLESGNRQWQLAKQLLQNKHSQLVDRFDKHNDQVSTAELARILGCEENSVRYVVVAHINHLLNYHGCNMRLGETGPNMSGNEVGTSQWKFYLSVPRKTV